MNARNTRLIISAISIALALSACSPSPHPAAPAPTGTTQYAGSQLAFGYPAQWMRYSFPDGPSTFSVPILYLSTDRLHDPCTVTGGNTDCTEPIGRLSAGGVLIAWSADGAPGWTLARLTGTSTTIATRPAKVRTEVPGDCVGVGGQVSITAYIDSGDAEHWYEMDACVNGPNAVAGQRQVMAMLATLQVLHP